MNNATPANDVTDTAAAFARENARLADAAKGHTRGAKYRAGMTGPEIAKAIRADIKAAQKAGDLPAMKVSVRCESSSLHNAIRVFVKAWDGQVWSTARALYDLRNPGAYNPTRFYSRSAESVLDGLRAIVAAYNYDRSDVQTDYFDVNFYSTVDFSSDLRVASKRDVESTIRSAFGVAS